MDTQDPINSQNTPAQDDATTPPQTDQNDTENLKNQLAEMENRWKRALADYRNLERRTQEERAQIFEMASFGLVSDLLPILDNLELVCKHLSDDGLKMVVKEFKKVMEREGVVEIETTDKNFDLNTMEAIDLVDGDKDKVIETISKGYKLKNKLVRPARVKVGKG